MITLKTLPVATEQQVFDQVASHLLKQMEKSASADVCAYRSPEGLKCAAGCLIADDEYNPEWEAVGWFILQHKGVVTIAHRDLIVRLQEVHDYFEPDEWRKKLKHVAKEYKLEWTHG